MDHAGHAHTTRMLPDQAKRVRTSLRKARGILEKLEGMLDEDRYCIDIAQQVNASIGLLKGANKEILVSHLQTCGVEKLASSNPHERHAFIEEVLRVANVTSRAA